MPKRGQRNVKAKEPAKKRRQEEPDEVLNLMDNEGEKESGNNKNVGENHVDFEAFLREAGLLEARGACGGPDDRSPVNSSTNLSLTAAGIEPVRSLSEEVFVHVPFSLREQIWRGEYINLAILLKGAIELKNICSPNLLRVNQRGFLEARPKECSDTLSTIEKWTDAFVIFMSLVIVRKPEQAPEMLRYMFLIREVSQGGHFAWQVYDSQFRLRQSMHPTAWSVINSDLWNRCVIPVIPVIPAETSLTFGSSGSNGFASATQSSARGPCYKFNDHGYCQYNKDCKFQHSCQICGLGHGKVNCPRGYTSSVNPSRGVFRGSQGRGSRFFKRTYGRGNRR